MVNFLISLVLVVQVEGAINDVMLEGGGGFRST